MLVIGGNRFVGLRLAQGQPIYLPNPHSQISMIHSADAAQFLDRAVLQNLEGPLNVASPKPIAVQDLILKLEKRLNKKALLIDQETDANHSPYGFAEDLYVDTSKLRNLGHEPRPIADWLDELIDEVSSQYKTVTPDPRHRHRLN